MSRRAIAIIGLMLAGLLAQPVVGQVSGTIFEDRDGDGIRDAGEPALSDVDVTLYGRTGGGSAVDQTIPTGVDGTFSFAPGTGCYLLSPADPPGWRPSQIREDGWVEGTAPYAHPVGQPRYSKLDQLVSNLRAGSVRYSAMGDSIAYNFNLCSYPEVFWYSKQFRSRLACAAPGATITLDEAAVKGEHSDDLLWDETNDLNNVFRTIDNQPELVTISIIGNDLLDAEPGASPTPSQVNLAVAEVLDGRQNLQEILSTLVTQIPDADIVLNTLYDNEAYNCNSGDPSDFHRTWIPILGRILRDVAWGQARRVVNAEIAADFAHEDQLGQCTGFDGLICQGFLGLDQIHPTNPGFDVVREKLWEAAGGVSLGSGDVLGRTSAPGVDVGYLRHLIRLLPREWETLGGAVAVDPASALSDADGGAPAALTLGAGGEEFRLSGFPDWYDELQIVRVLAGVRYRTTGTVGDDFYRMEASVNGQFRPAPGFNYTPTEWNFYTPLVGGGGPNQPVENPDYPGAALLAVPDVPTYRDVSAMLTKNPVLLPGAPDYEWPAVTHEELATTVIRVMSAPVAGTSGNDAYQVELDAAWLDLYGWEKPRPDEVASLRAERLADGTLRASFDELPGSGRYNLYSGSLSSLRVGAYDHGQPTARCGATTQPAGEGRLSIDAPSAELPAGDLYFLVTAHVDEVESPSGHDATGAEIDRSQSVCR